MKVDVEASSPDRPSSWTEWDPKRVDRELREVPALAPNLTFLNAGNHSAPYGGWSGQLPLWPFDRPEPAGLRSLAATPLTILLQYSPVHPAVSPNIYPIAPAPRPAEISVTQWHVLPNGALCLLQSEGLWIPEASTTELLLKASGWRIEYALIEAGAISEMTIRGIVEDTRLDAVITETATGQAVAGRD